MENREENFLSRRRWLARLSVSFLIVAAFLGYTAYRGWQSHEISRGRMILYLIAAMLAFVLFLLGTAPKASARG